jgi:hypothetical protein
MRPRFLLHYPATQIIKVTSLTLSATEGRLRQRDTRKSRTKTETKAFEGNLNASEAMNRIRHHGLKKIDAVNACVAPGKPQIPEVALSKMQRGFTRRTEHAADSVEVRRPFWGMEMVGRGGQLLVAAPFLFPATSAAGGGRTLFRASTR